jgi:L,D-transpeptidase catalytic domain
MTARPRGRAVFMLGRLGVRAGLLLVGIAGVIALVSPSADATTISQLRPDVILSNETTSSTWALADYLVAIHAKPSYNSAKLAQLQVETPDQEALQSYLLLRERWTSSGAWIKLRIPMRPNGKTGWVPRWSLGAFHHTEMQIVVNRAARQLTLYRSGHTIYTAPVGVGKPSTPTPPGHFWITESFPSLDPFYGPYAFGTSDYAQDTDFPDGSIVGLHGTNEPSLIPGDPSHGCIRLLNNDIVALSHIVKIGTPLLIQ